MNNFKKNKINYNKTNRETKNKNSNQVRTIVISLSISQKVIKGKVLSLKQLAWTLRFLSTQLWLQMILVNKRKFTDLKDRLNHMQAQIFQPLMKEFKLP